MSTHPVAFPVRTKKPDLSQVQVALVSMPWRWPRLPAIGLASLKASALEAGAKRCDVLYLNDRWFRFLLEHGRLSEEIRRTKYTEFTRIISDLGRVMLAVEWMFSSVVFGGDVCAPDLFAEIFEKEAATHRYARFSDDLLGNARLAGIFVDECVRQTDWSRYDVVGMSCVFDQLLPSLALAKKLRSAGFGGKIVFGGPQCEGIVGKRLLSEFDFVDAVFDGESELSFPAYLGQIVQPSGTPMAPGTWQRATDGSVFKAPGSAAIKNMDVLPMPIYTDYFDEIDAHQLLTHREVTFPVEASRGCWWGQHHHCIFCGLNGSDMTYRAKSPERIHHELQTQHSAHQLAYVAFTDNIISLKFMRPLMERLQEKPLPLRYFIETKANLSRRQVKEYKRAGVEFVQPGIESMSSHVLDIMDKGITALANVACLKYCREAQVTTFWNLLHSFPRETREDYEQTLRFLQAMVHLDAPQGMWPMDLTRFSPSFTDSEALGFHDKRPAQYHRLMYPYPDEVLSDLVNTFDFSFRDDIDRDALVQPIQQFIDEWKSHKQPGVLVLANEPSGPVLCDTRFNRAWDHRALAPLEMIVYEFCDAPREFADIARAAAEHHAHVTDGQVRAVLASFVADRTMVTEAGSYLSLALHDDEFFPWPTHVKRVGSAVEQV
jgi:ribosomal peptide maturation radical SAM protein 1